MTKFRPCIDLHNGKVKQIVGSTLNDTSDNSLITNFESDKDSSWYSDLYKKHALTGGHIIQLGPNNFEATMTALKAYPQGMQVGGGITTDNAEEFLNAGASQVIVTSFLFENNEFSMDRLKQLFEKVGKDQLVIDLSCTRVGNKWFVATNRWQTTTSFEINEHNIKELENYCCEFLIHAAHVEGKQQGMDEELIAFLSSIVTIPTTYAGGAKSLDDLHKIKQISNGKLDLTIGSALDIFKGNGVRFADCVAFNQSQSR